MFVFSIIFKQPQAHADHCREELRGEGEQVQHMHKLNNAARQFECGPSSGFTCGLAVNAVERGREEVEVCLGGE